jgi:hypothetical protein
VEWCSLAQATQAPPGHSLLGVAGIVTSMVSSWLGPSCRLVTVNPQGVSAGLEDNLSPSWQLNMKSQSHSGSAQRRDREGSWGVQVHRGPSLVYVGRRLGPNLDGDGQHLEGTHLSRLSLLVVSILVVSLRVVTVAEGLAAGGGGSISASGSHTASAGGARIGGAGSGAPPSLPGGLDRSSLVGSRRGQDDGWNMGLPVIIIAIEKEPHPRI